MCRRDEAVAALERLGFAVRERDATRVTVAVPPWRNDVARRRGAGSGRRARPRGGAPCGGGLRGDRARMRSDRGGAASARPRFDPACLPAARRAGARRHVDAAPVPRRAREAGACRAGAGRMRHLQLHGGARGGAVRRHAREPAADQPDRHRSGPASPHAGRHAGARRAAQRRARLAGCRAVRGRTGVSRRAARRRSRPGCAPARRRGAGRCRRGPSMRWTPRPICSRRWRR